MILVESDTSDEWDSRTGWADLADAAVKAAIAATPVSGFFESALAVEVSVKYTSDEEIRALNASYRGKDRPTNVLSFPMVAGGLLEPLVKADGGEVLLGDIVLAHGICVREAAEKAIPIRDHASHLIVHGTLHLLGYDHEQGARAADAMEDLERSALASLGVADPYPLTEANS
jgi:probable rRNA maturation factor